MAKVMEESNPAEEFRHLLGDARFRSLRMHCLNLEGMQKLGFRSIPWTEQSLRSLLNELQTAAVSPAKIQRFWHTLKFLSVKLGMTDPHVLPQLQEKKNPIQDSLVDTIIKPSHKAKVPP